MIKRNLKLGGSGNESDKPDQLYDTIKAILENPHVSSEVFPELVASNYSGNQADIELLKKHLFLHKNYNYLTKEEYEEIIKDESHENLLDNCLKIWIEQQGLLEKQRKEETQRKIELDKKVEKLTHGAHKGNLCYPWSQSNTC